MRILVMFDLPIGSNLQKRAYRKFRKKLITSGFFMLQESVYIKLVPNSFAANTLINKLKQEKPEEGSVLALKVTEKQFAKMEFIVGESHGEVLDSDERLVIL